MTHVTPQDNETAQENQARWAKRTSLSQAYAVQCGGKFPGLLPHVIAEIVEDYQAWIDAWRLDQDR